MNYFILGAGFLYLAGAYTELRRGSIALGVVYLSYACSNFVLALFIK